MQIQSVDINTFLQGRFDPTNRHKQAIRNVMATWQDDRKVAVTFSEYLTGLNRHSGKRWFKWHTQEATGIYRMDNGTLMPYSRIRGRDGKWKNQVPVTVFARLDNMLSAHDRFEPYRQAMEETFKVTSLKDVYPIAELYDISQYEQMPASIRKFMREDNFRDFVEVSYGKSVIRKDLVKAAAKVNPGYVNYTRAFRGKVPADWIVGFLRNHEESTLQMPHVNERTLAEVLATVDERTLRTLLRDNVMTHNEYYMLQDTMNYLGNTNAHWRNNPWESLADKRFASWREIHDAAYAIPPRRNGMVHRNHNAIAANPVFTGVYTPPKPPEPEEVKLNELSEKIHNAEFGGYKFKCPTMDNELDNWSDIMGNCIRSYKYQAKTGYSVYAAVYKNDRMMCNIEISKHLTNVQDKKDTWELRQLLGKHNNPLDKEGHDTLVSFLEMQGVDCSGDYWGKWREPVKARVPAGEGWRDIGYIQEDAVANPLQFW